MRWKSAILERTSRNSRTEKHKLRILFQLQQQTRHSGKWEDKCVERYSFVKQMNIYWTSTIYQIHEALSYTLLHLIPTVILQSILPTFYKWEIVSERLRNLTKVTQLVGTITHQIWIQVFLTLDTVVVLFCFYWSTFD